MARGGVPAGLPIQTLPWPGQAGQPGGSFGGPGAGGCQDSRKPLCDPCDAKPANKGEGYSGAEQNPEPKPPPACPEDCSGCSAGYSIALPYLECPDPDPPYKKWCNGQSGGLMPHVNPHATCVWVPKEPPEPGEWIGWYMTEAVDCKSPGIWQFGVGCNRCGGLAHYEIAAPGGPCPTGTYTKVSGGEDMPGSLTIT